MAWVANRSTTVRKAVSPITSSRTSAPDERRLAPIAGISGVASAVDVLAMVSVLLGAQGESDPSRCLCGFRLAQWRGVCPLRRHSGLRSPSMVGSSSDTVG